jgi:hypothetical protein
MNIMGAWLGRISLMLYFPAIRSFNLTDDLFNLLLHFCIPPGLAGQVLQVSLFHNNPLRFRISR